MTDATEPASTEAAGLSIAERVSAIEAILLRVPLVVAEFLIIPSLFVPFVTYEVDDVEMSPSLLTMPFASFARSIDPDASDAAVSGLFAVAFLALLLVMITAIIALPRIPARRQSMRVTRFITAIATLLAVGTVCTWLVVAIGVTSSDAWTVEAGLPLLTAGALIAVIVTRLSAYRSLWAYQSTGQ